MVFVKFVGHWKIRVRFRDFAKRKCAFVLSQSSSSVVVLVVNSGRKDFTLQEFARFLPAPTLKDQSAQIDDEFDKILKSGKFKATPDEAQRPTATPDLEAKQE